MGHKGETFQRNTSDESLKEEDSQMRFRIRSMEMIKHNPRAFYTYPADPSFAYEVMGGHKTGMTIAASMAF